MHLLFKDVSFLFNNWWTNSNTEKNMSIGTVLIEWYHNTLKNEFSKNFFMDKKF